MNKWVEADKFSGVMNKKTVSVSLILLFISVLALPLLAMGDDCEVYCTRMEPPCCEAAQVKMECPSMVPGREAPPVLFPVAPGPKKSESVFTLTAGSLLSIPTEMDRKFGQNYQATATPGVKDLKIPLYYATHSLLI